MQPPGLMFCCSKGIFLKFFHFLGQENVGEGGLRAESGNWIISLSTDAFYPLDFVLAELSQLVAGR